MADQKRWFKVWTSIVSDDDFDPSRTSGLIGLGRFSILGAYTALHGQKGAVDIMPDTLFRITQARDLDELRADLALKKVQFIEGKNHHGKITVTWAKWQKYQEDSTQAERQRTSRSKKRREERREEENIKSPAEAAGPVEKKRETEQQNAVALFDPQVKRALRLAGSDLHAQQKMTQWVLSMAHCLKAEPAARTLAVVTACLDQFESKIKSGYTVTSLWGLMTVIFDKERTKYIQGPENAAHKTAPVPPVMRQFLHGIGSG